MQELKNKGPPGMIILLVGNKSDLADDQRKVDSNEVAQYAEKNSMLHIETSALDSSNVESAFNIIVNSKCNFLFINHLLILEIHE